MGKIELAYKKKDLKDLTPEEVELLEKANAAIKFSHAPYSNFKVSCAVRLSDGKIVTGTNQENAAYPSTLCAERVALFSAKGTSDVEIREILVVAQNGDHKSADAFSCGNCRQVMLEYAGLQLSPIKILMGTKENLFIEIQDVRDLLPFHFNSDSLE